MIYSAAYARNQLFAQPSLVNYQTRLSTDQEKRFRQWVLQNQVPFNTDDLIVDYDMRGYWANTAGVGWARGSHFPDTYKTPYHATFSAESRYATTDNPFIWINDDNLVDIRTGLIVT